MDLVGKVLGNRYEIVKKIGVGGMATVYKARCNVLNRYVAVKVLREEYITDEEFVKRFNSEAQAAASLSHPNIVSVYDVAHDGNTYYIVMELIKGKTLKEIIDTDGILSWKWSVNIAIQIAQALEVAHKNNIIHRDIKPHNIIITEEGVAKVTDFGIAKAVSNSTITAFGTTLGSVHYFSPEHAKGGYTDAKSDIYSLGVVLYEMLTGKVPFDADTPVSIALKHIQEEPVEPIKLNPNIPQSLNNIILKSMRKEPSERYKSASELLEDLKEILKNPHSNLVAMSEESSYAKTQRVQTVAVEPKKENGGYKEVKKEKEKSVFKRPVVAIIIVLVLILVFLISILVTYKYIQDHKPVEVVLPNIVGMKQEEAKEKLENLKLKYELIDERFDDESEANTILVQDPPYQENFKIYEDSVIKVIVSKGKEIIKLPDVKKKKVEEATEELEKLGLRVDVNEENNKDVEEGLVIRQEPTAEMEVPGKSTVKIYVSKGVKKVVVPNVIGKSVDEAKKIIEEAELTLKNVISETDTTKDADKIIKQTLESGKEVEEKSEISITVNSLPQIKTGTLNINVASITGYKPKKVTVPVTTEKDTSKDSTKDTNKNTVTNKVEDGKVTNTTVETKEVIAEPAKVELMVKVTSQGTEDIVYKKEVAENLDNVTVSFQGVGNVTVKVYIAGLLERTEMLNLNQENPTLNIK